jgi:hypothetical protein
MLNPPMDSSLEDAAGAVLFAVEGVMAGGTDPLAVAGGAALAGTTGAVLAVAFVVVLVGSAAPAGPVNPKIKKMKPTQWDLRPHLYNSMVFIEYVFVWVGSVKN